MQLSKRLQGIADFVPYGSKVADIGTDHAYVPIYLVKSKICDFCVASDINRGPILKAQSHLSKYHVDNIILKQAEGLKGIKDTEIDTVIIAGMGGYLIIDILRNDLDVVKGIKQLILQPQHDIPQVRKYLHSIGFRIEDELFLEEDGKYYTIISALPGREIYTKEYEYVYGKVCIEKKNEDFKKWLVEKYEKLKAIRPFLSISDTDKARLRSEEFEKELLLHQEVMKCIF